MSTSNRNAYHHGDLRGVLVALALKIVDQDGPEALSLRDVAERAGVSGMAPYRHFADKAALLEAVARQGFAELRERLSAVDDPSDARKALIAFGVVYVRFACERPGLFRLMFGGRPPTSDAEVAGKPDTVFGLFSARIAEIAPPAQRQIAFLACWSSMHGLASLLAAGRLRGPAPPPEELARRVAEVVLAGLRA